MDPEALRARTKAFGVRIVHLVRALPRDRASDVIGKQLLRCGTSVGANYRAAARARSRADFVNKLGIVEEEIDESAFWLELLVDTDIVSARKLAPLRRECDEITAIVVASARTARRRAKAAAAIR